MTDTPKPSDVATKATPKGKVVSSNITVTIEEITPEVATKMLERNTENRSVRDTRVAALVRDIENGHFQTTHQGVAFDETGTMIDGQHRLWAVVRSGKTVEMMITRGLPREVKPTIDTGAKRTFGDMLLFAGYSNRIVMSAITRMHLLYTREIPMGNYSMGVTETELLEHLEKHEELFHTAAKLAVSWKDGIGTTPQVIGTAWAIFAEIDPEAATEFFSDMVNATTRGEGDARLALMNRLRRKNDKGERIPPALQLSMVIKAWNNWRNGTPTPRINLDRLRTKKVLEAI